MNDAYVFHSIYLQGRGDDEAWLRLSFLFLGFQLRIFHCLFWVHWWCWGTRIWRICSGDQRHLFKVGKQITLGQKPTLFRNYQEFDVWKMLILWKMRFWKCEFYEKLDFERVNFVKSYILKMWILRKWGFENVNFVKNEILKRWILLKSEIIKMWIFGWIADFCSRVGN